MADDAMSADSIISAHERGISHETVLTMAGGVKQKFSDADVVRMLRAGVDPALISGLTGREQPTAAQKAEAAKPIPKERPPEDTLPELDNLDPEEREFLLEEARARAAENEKPATTAAPSSEGPSLLLGSLSSVQSGSSRTFSGLGISGRVTMVQVVENHLHISLLESVFGPAFRFKIDLEVRNTSTTPIPVDVGLTSTTAYVAKPKVHKVYDFDDVVASMREARERDEEAAYNKNFVVTVTTSTSGQVGAAGQSVPYSETTTTSYVDRSPAREQAYAEDMAAIELHYAQQYLEFHERVFEARELGPGDVESGSLFGAGPARAEAEYALTLRIAGTSVRIPMGRMPSS